MGAPLSLEERKEILALWEEGHRNMSEIGRRVGKDRHTVAKVLRDKEHKEVMRQVDRTAAASLTRDEVATLKVLASMTRFCRCDCGAVLPYPATAPGEAKLWCPECCAVWTVTIERKRSVSPFEPNPQP